MTESAASAAAIRRPKKRQISGMVVHVRLGLAVAVLGAVAAAGSLGLSVFGSAGWDAGGLIVTAVALSVAGAWTGIWGVIRYGLFTEGCGAQTIAGELRLSRYAYWAGVISQLALMVAVIAAAALVVRLVV